MFQEGWSRFDHHFVVKAGAQVGVSLVVTAVLWPQVAGGGAPPGRPASCFLRPAGVRHAEPRPPHRRLQRTRQPGPRGVQKSVEKWVSQMTGVLRSHFVAAKRASRFFANGLRAALFHLQLHFLGPKLSTIGLGALPPDPRRGGHPPGPPRLCGNGGP